MKSLLRVTRRYRQGEYGSLVEVIDDDELGELAVSVNMMGK